MWGSWKIKIVLKMDRSQEYLEAKAASNMKKTYLQWLNDTYPREVKNFTNHPPILLKAIEHEPTVQDLIDYLSEYPLSHKIKVEMWGKSYKIMDLSQDTQDREYINIGIDENN